MDERNLKLSRHVKARYGTSLEKLNEAADAVEAVLQMPGWGILQDLVKDETDLVDRVLDEAQPLQQAEYAYAHGRRGGLRAVEGFARLVIAARAAETERQRDKHEQPEAAESASER